MPLACAQGGYWTREQTIYLLEQLHDKGKSRNGKGGEGGYPFTAIAAQAGTRLGGRDVVHAMFEAMKSACCCVVHANEHCLLCTDCTLSSCQVTDIYVCAYTKVCVCV